MKEAAGGSSRDDPGRVRRQIEARLSCVCLRSALRSHLLPWHRLVRRLLMSTTITNTRRPGRRVCECAARGFRLRKTSSFRRRHRGSVPARAAPRTSPPPQVTCTRGMALRGLRLRLEIGLQTAPRILPRALWVSSSASGSAAGAPCSTPTAGSAGSCSSHRQPLGQSAHPAGTAAVPRHAAVGNRPDSLCGLPHRVLWLRAAAAGRAIG